MRRFTLLLSALILLVGLLPSAPAVAHDDHFHVLVFSKTAGFRHGSIPSGIQAIQALGAAEGWAVDATEDATAFNDTNLANYDAVVWLSTTGDVLDATQQAAFERYIQAGGGFVGVHAASDTEYGWSWYGGLVGAYFSGHPAGTPSATITVADAVHPSTAHLPGKWARVDEWYNFQTNPRGNVHVLASLEESTIAGGGGTMGADHPIAWCQDYDGGRAWYTGGGHTSDSFSEPDFVQHLKGGIETAGGLVAADCGGTVWDSYEKVALDTNTQNPMKLDVAPDGAVFYVERFGELRRYDPATQATSTVLSLNVYSGQEDGLLAVAVDPGFPTDPWLYLYYAAPGTVSCPATDSGANVCGNLRLSRFTFDGTTVLPSSEKVLLQVTSQRDRCCHAAGDLAFDADGNLYLATGDDTDPFESSGYTPTDERAGRTAFDAQRTSGNTNDLRGKILRVHPEDDGTVSIPSGNLFAPGTAQTRPEIYAMGFRNPFTIATDPQTGALAVADYGPDAGSSNGQRGPDGRVEWNLITSAGNYGWPYCVGANTPYNDYNFSTTVSTGTYSCTAPTNDSPNNTGLTNLPAARPATVWYGKSSTGAPTIGNGGGPMAGPVFRHDESSSSDTQLPAYFDGTAFFMEWTTQRLYELKLDGNGGVLDINPFLADESFLHPHAMDTGPDGSLYLIEWGSGFGGNNADSGIYRIDYLTGSRHPVAKAAATPDSGPVPLEVQFSSAGSGDPDPGDTITYAWDFTSDGTVDSTDPNPTFSYTQAGTFEARLVVTDQTDKTSVATVPIVAGNTRPEVTIDGPVNGGLFAFGDQIAFDVTVTDAEDGTTADGSIDCADVTVTVFLGHATHAHPLQEVNGCHGQYDTIRDDGHGVTEKLFSVIEVTYADEGGAAGAGSLTGRTLHELQPRHQQAVHFTDSSGIQLITHAEAESGTRVGAVDDGDWIAFEPINLRGIDTVDYRIAAGGPGGTIELREGSPGGPLLSTATVPSTGSWDTYADIGPFDVTDPGTTHTLYAVFRGNGGGLFDVDTITFNGKGVASNAAPIVSASATPRSGAAPLEVTFDGSSVDAEGHAVTHTWDFGDGTTGDGPATTHTYTETGTYTAVLSGVDELGARGSDTVTIEVGAAPSEPVVCIGTRSDRFDADGLNRDRWSVVHESQGGFEVSDGALRLPTAPGDLYGASNSADNLILQPMPLGAWTATTRVSLDAVEQFQQAGLILYADDDNYLKLDLLATPARTIEFIAESMGTPRNAAADKTGLPADFPTTFNLRLISDGLNVTAAYSADGITYTPVGRAARIPVSLSALRVGMFALGGDVAPPVTEAAFDWFHLLPDATATDPGIDDEFDGDRLDGCRWDRVVREDPTSFSVANGELRVETQSGDIFGAGNSDPLPPNLFLQTMPAGDWVIQTHFDEQLVGQYQQAGLMVYADDDNYVKFDVIADANQTDVNRLELRSEVAAAASGPNLTPPANTGEWYLRLVKTGNSYVGRVSTDGQNWTSTTSVTNSAVAGSGFGLYTLGVNQPAPAVVSFDYFRMLPGGDEAKPTVASSVDPAPDGQDDWHLSAPLVTLTADDGGGSGIDRIEYIVVPSGTPEPWNDGAEEDYTGPIEMGQEGQFEVRFRAYDMAGNRSEIGTQTVKVDLADPVVETTVEPSSPGASGWYTAQPVVTLDGTDGTGSGVTGIDYQIRPAADPTWVPADAQAYSHPFGVPDGDVVVRFRATDGAGRVSTAGTLPLKVDTVAPVSEATLDPPAPQSSDGTYTSAVTVALAASDALSGVAATEYSLNGGGRVAYDGPVTVHDEGRHVVTFRSSDHAGNQEEDRSVAFTIGFQPPAADPGGPYGADEGQVVLLDGQGSSSPTDQVLSYFWDIGGNGQIDGTESTLEFDASTVDGPVTIPVTLSVCHPAAENPHDPRHCGVEATQVVVRNVAPTVNAVEVASVSPGHAVEVEVTGVHDPSRADVLTATVSWGDGTETVVDGPTESFHASHAYAGPGDHTITVTVDDGDDVSATVETGVRANLAPTVNAHDGTADQHTTVPLSADAADPDGDPLTYRWEIVSGDGTIDDPASASPTLTVGAGYGTVEVALTVTDGLDSATDTATIQVIGTNCMGVPATIVGTPGKDKIKGTDGDDVIVGLGGDDSIDGKDGNDIICGGDGKDHLDGDDGDDVLYGEGGDDKLHGKDGNDTIHGGNGDDDIKGDGGDDVLHGDAGQDKVKGGDGDDQLFGGDDDDKLDGGKHETGDYADGGVGLDECKKVEQHDRCELGNLPGLDDDDESDDSDVEDAEEDDDDDS